MTITCLLASLPCLFAAMSTAEAVATLLNSKSASGVAKYEQAREKIEREAAEGRPLQQFVIGITTDDRALAAKYLDASREKIRRMAERKNNALAWYLLSVDRNDFEMLKKAAAGGNVQALNQMGRFVTEETLRCQNGSSNVVARLLKRSYEYFNAAAAKGDPNGYINLGACYLRGLGCPQDMAMAFTCFKAAADAGHPEGMDNMSACYQFGHGVRQDDELSLYWAMRGRAARGNEPAAKWLKERR